MCDFLRSFHIEFSALPYISHEALVYYFTIIFPIAIVKSRLRAFATPRISIAYSVGLFGWIFHKFSCRYAPALYTCTNTNFHIIAYRFWKSFRRVFSLPHRRVGRKSRFRRCFHDKTRLFHEFPFRILIVLSLRINGWTNDARGVFFMWKFLIVCFHLIFL